MKCVSGRRETRPLPGYLNCPRISEVAFFLGQKEKYIDCYTWLSGDSVICDTIVNHNIARYSALWPVRDKMARCKLSFS